MKTVTLPEFLTDAEIRIATNLWKNRNTALAAISGKSYAQAICERIIRPNIDRINKALGQENDPMFLSYAVEYVMSQGGAN